MEFDVLKIGLSEARVIWGRGEIWEVKGVWGKDEVGATPVRSDLGPLFKLGFNLISCCLS